MRILVVGAGAVGGYFGARLAQAGRDVTFLVRQQRFDTLTARGLRILGHDGTVEVIEPALVTADAIDGPYDLILLTVKAFGLDQAMGDIAPAVGDNTVIIPFLNGMAHLDRLSSRFGRERVYGGVCLVATTVDADGGIKQLRDLQSLSWGPLAADDSDRATAIGEVLAGAGFHAAASPDIRHAMWEKWVFLAALGAITCLMRGTIGQVNTAGGTGFATAVLAETAAIATAAGYPPQGSFLNTSRATLTDASAPLTSSLYRDLVAGRRLEADQILGDLVDRAAGSGVAAPMLSLAYTHLRVYQAGIEA